MRYTTIPLLDASFCILPLVREIMEGMVFTLVKLHIVTDSYPILSVTGHH